MTMYFRNNASYYDFLGFNLGYKLLFADLHSVLMAADEILLGDTD